MFAFLRVIGLFLRSEAPGLVFSEEKNGGLPPVTSEKPHDPRVLDIACKQFDAPSGNSYYASDERLYLSLRGGAHGRMLGREKAYCRFGERR